MLLLRMLGILLPQNIVPSTMAAEVATGGQLTSHLTRVLQLSTCHLLQCWIAPAAGKEQISQLQQRRRVLSVCLLNHMCITANMPQQHNNKLCPASCWWRCLRLRKRLGVQSHGKAVVCAQSNAALPEGNCILPNPNLQQALLE